MLRQIPNKAFFALTKKPVKNKKLMTNIEPHSENEISAIGPCHKA